MDEFEYSMLCRCPSWMTADATPTSGYLQSYCVTNGTWTATKPNHKDSLSYPTPPYPKPDAVSGQHPSPLGCSCQDLVLTYDPNEEASAIFICNEPITMADDLYIITPDNMCTLYCDGLYVATAKCSHGEWTGSPEYGFWCYQDPGDRSSLLV